MEDAQVLIMVLVDDESTRHFMQPTDVAVIDVTNVAQIMGGCVSSDGRLTIKNATCAMIDFDMGCVILEIDGQFYPGTCYCTYIDSVTI